jgi:hypothetical protein
MVGETMTKRPYVRLETRPMELRLPVPRPACPVCQTLYRIRRRNEIDLEPDPDPPLIRRGGVTGSCGSCNTRFEVFVTKDTISDEPLKTTLEIRRFKFVAVELHNMVKDALANYWIATHKGPLPKILQLEEVEI